MATQARHRTITFDDRALTEMALLPEPARIDMLMVLATLAQRPSAIAPDRNIRLAPLPYAGQHCSLIQMGLTKAGPDARDPASTVVLAVGKDELSVLLVSSGLNLDERELAAARRRTIEAQAAARATGKETEWVL